MAGQDYANVIQMHPPHQTPPWHIVCLFHWLFVFFFLCNYTVPQRNAMFSWNFVQITTKKHLFWKWKIQFCPNLVNVEWQVIALDSTLRRKVWRLERNLGNAGEKRVRANVAKLGSLWSVQSATRLLWMWFSACRLIGMKDNGLLVPLWPSAEAHRLFSSLVSDIRSGAGQMIELNDIRAELANFIVDLWKLFKLCCRDTFFLIMAHLLIVAVTERIVGNPTLRCWFENVII